MGGREREEEGEGRGWGGLNVSDDGVWRTSDVHVLRATFQSHAISQSVAARLAVAPHKNVGKKKKNKDDDDDDNNTTAPLSFVRGVPEVSRSGLGRSPSFSVQAKESRRMRWRRRWRWRASVSVASSHAPFTAETLVRVRIPNGFLPHA